MIQLPACDKYQPILDPVDSVWLVFKINCEKPLRTSDKEKLYPHYITNTKTLVVSVGEEVQMKEME